MRRCVVLVLCVSLLAGGSGAAALADLKPGTYAPDIEAGDWMNTDGQEISLTELRGMITVLFFWVSWHQGGERIMPLMTLVNSSPHGKAGGVYLIGVTDAERGRIEDMLKREKAFFPIALNAKKTIEDYDIASFPRVVVIDPSGKVAWTGWPMEVEKEDGAPKLLEEIARIHAEHPPRRTHPELAAMVQTYLKSARQALRAGRFREAFEAADRAYENALVGDPLKSRCQDMLDLVEALGRSKLAEAEQAVDQRNYADAVARLYEVRRDFRGVAVSLAAKRKLDALRTRYKDVAELLKQHESTGVAETVLQSAIDLVQAREFGPAYVKLELIVEEYPNTETATKAQTLIDRMQRNATIASLVRDHKASRDCQRLMGQAEAFLRAGQPAKAREFYRQIVEKYPDTTYADEAVKRLAQIL